MGRKERTETLLKAASETFNEASDPFHRDWLIEHEVTGDECLDLSNTIAAILAGYLVTPKDERLDIVARGAAALSGMDANIMEGVLEGQRRKRLLKKLSA